MMASASPTLDDAELADLRQRRLELRSQFMQVRVRRESDPALIATKRALAKVDQQLAAADAVPLFDQFRRVGHSLFTLQALGRNGRRVVLHEAGTSAFGHNG
jgi:hypothetical protein